MNKKTLIIIGTIIGVIVLVLVSGIIWYNSGINAVKTDNPETKVIEIAEKTRTEGILELLKNEQLIKNKLAVAAYMKLNNIKGLQAGKYQLSQNMSAKEILEKISSGDVYNENIKITFKEGKNMRWIAKTIAEHTNNTEEDVFS